MGDAQQNVIALNTPPAYDFQDGVLRIWSGGEVVAEFKRNCFPNLVLDIVTQLKDDSK